MDKIQFDHVCQMHSMLIPAGNSYACSSYKVTLGAHWYYGDHKVAVFVDNNGDMIYSDISISTEEELAVSLDKALIVFESAVHKQISYERLVSIPAEGINVSGKGVIV